MTLNKEIEASQGFKEVIANNVALQGRFPAVVNHNNTTGLTYWHCFKCMARFDTQSGLEQHARNHAPDGLPKDVINLERSNETEQVLAAVLSEDEKRTMSAWMKDKPVPAGVKHDMGKLPLELLPIEVLAEVAKVLQFGANKYKANNWRGGIKYSRVFGATLRHLYAWWQGEDNDAETNLSHLAHAICELMFALSYVLKDKKQLDDRSEHNV